MTKPEGMSSRTWLRCAVGGIGLTLLLPLVACDDGSRPDSPETIERETFIATYVALRRTGLATGGTPDAARRDSVLAEHGVTEDDLLGFVEAHGTDVEYMDEAWREIDARIRGVSPDSANEGGTGDRDGPEETAG